MKDYLVAFDSDGCVFDAMEPKHRRCFIPACLEAFGIDPYRREFTELWLNINLYSKTRGMNRFLTLEMTLDAMKEAGYGALDVMTPLKQWIAGAKELSTAALEEYAGELASPELLQVLGWSLDVNRRIKEIADDILPYAGAPESIRQVSQAADVAVVSSANYEAIHKEWGKFSLLDCVTEMCGQEKGTKKECLHLLKNKGYQSVLMVGDAPGDMEAAQANGCLFYPIIPGREEWSWAAFKDIVFNDFMNGKYINENEYRRAFKELILQA